MWRIALLAAVLLGLAGAVATRLSREWHTSAQTISTVLAGPDVEGIKRWENKHRIVVEVLAGRMSLFEAASAFRRLDDLSPRWDRAPDRFPKAASEDEAYCRAALASVRREVEAAKWSGAVTNALQTELDAQLRDETLHLAP